MNALVVPVEGRVELAPIAFMHRAADLLSTYGAEGTYVEFNFNIDGEPGGRVGFFVHPQADPNIRARRILADLCGVHMVMPGPVAFMDIDPALVDGLVRDL
jgi:hypothetical protein